MFPRLAAFTAFCFVLGCANFMRRDTRLDADRLPPTAREIAEKPDQKNVVWWKTFREGDAALQRKDRGTACLSFRRLAGDKDFPLRELATLRAHEACIGTENLTPPEALSAEAQSWYEETSVRARLAHDLELTRAEKVRLLWDQARLEKADRKRELLLIDALSIAEKENDESLIAAARDKLWSNSPRLKQNPEKKDLPLVVRDLRRWREFSRAIGLERSRLKDKTLTEDERFRILKNIRETYKVAQRRDEMLTATADLLNFAKRSFKRNKKNASSSRRLLEAHVIYTRAVWTENRRDLALKSLNEARRDLQGKVSLEEIYFLFARMAEEIRNLAEAEAYLEKALTEAPAVPGLRDKMTWSRAWLLHKMDRREEALRAFTGIAETSKDGGEIARALFWKARSLPEGEERLKTLEDVRDRDPLGFYGLMALRDLGAPLPPIRSQSDKVDLSLWQSSEIPLRQALVAEWMISLDWHEGLAQVLDSIQSDLRKNKRASTEAWLRLTTSYARGGEFLPLFALMGQVPAELRDRLISEKPELLFPRPWPDEVARAAKAARVPPELIYAIMRQESAFNPRARSHAEAYGLMQLLPNVAGRLAAKYKTPYKGPESLYEPAVIIPLGAYELRTLFDRWKGIWVPSIASYNASEQAVRGWMKMRRREDPIEFIEEIPYEETRGYIKLVMRNQVFYQRLLASEATPFPENCLSIFHPTSSASN